MLALRWCCLTFIRFCFTHPFSISIMIWYVLQVLVICDWEEQRKGLVWWSCFTPVCVTLQFEKMRLSLAGWLNSWNLSNLAVTVTSHCMSHVAPRSTRWTSADDWSHDFLEFCRVCPPPQNTFYSESTKDDGKSQEPFCENLSLLLLRLKLLETTTFCQIQRQGQKQTFLPLSVSARFGYVKFECCCWFGSCSILAKYIRKLTSHNSWEVLRSTPSAKNYQQQIYKSNSKLN